MKAEIYSKTNCIFCDRAKIRLAKYNPKTIKSKKAIVPPTILYLNYAGDNLDLIIKIYLLDKD